MMKLSIKSTLAESNFRTADHSPSVAAVNRIAFVIILFLIFGSSVVAQGVKFEDTPYKQLLQQATVKKMPVFYFIHASWCPHCQKMQSDVFPDAQLGMFMNSHFISASRDGESGEGKAIMHKYQLNSFPSFIVLDGAGTLLYSFGGEFKIDTFLKELQTALTPEKQFPYLESQFNSDVSNSDKALAYIMALRKARMDASAAAKKYLATQEEKQLVNAVNWKIIANGVNDIDSREFQYVLSHQDEFAAVASKERVNRKIKNIVTELLRPFTESLDTTGYVKARPLAKSIHLRNTDSLVFNYDKVIWERTKNWAAYEKTIREGQEFIWDNPVALKEVALVFQDNYSASESLEFGLKLVVRSVELKDSFDGNLIAARIAKKLGNFDRARYFAEKARTYAKIVNFSTSEPDELLKSLN
ncbi:MAG: thioredoxin family protein [Flavobacterium sp.]|nr:MAG: thioredoxin family protein [Flavobacterium sp.]